MNDVRIVHLGTTIQTQFAAVNGDGEILERLPLQVNIERMTVHDFMLAGQHFVKVRQQFTEKYTPQPAAESVANPNAPEGPSTE